MTSHDRQSKKLLHNTIKQLKSNRNKNTNDGRNNYNIEALEVGKFPSRQPITQILTVAANLEW